LVLGGNNGEAALRAGEQGRFPGCHGDRQARLRELAERTADFLPIGLLPFDLDRSAADLARMSKPSRRFA
jgi:hypothetical protein